PHEFRDREDGLIGLEETYNLNFPRENIVGLDPGIMYQAVKTGDVDLITAFATDARIEGYELATLKDDKQFFPPYEAAYLYNVSLIKRFPEVENILKQTADLISLEEMRKLNYQVDFLQFSAKEVVSVFLKEKGVIDSNVKTSLKERESSLLNYFWQQRTYVLRLIRQHLQLTLIALSVALLAALPLGIALTRMKKLSEVIFAGINILQTIPSLALLGFLIPLLGIGVLPALVALFFYGLLPLVRNIYTGIKDIDDALKETATGMGLTSWEVLFKIELPMALPFVMAGIRTSTVILVGTATLAALVGGGGLGDPIFRGISSVNTSLILLGAVPTALLAIILDRFLLYLERKLISPGLRLQSASKV
ncbi:MAG: ABC transporter permease subunit, partial [Bacteriovoracia bacterium]